MTSKELREFQFEWLREAELQVSASADRECRLGHGHDLEIFDTYKEILGDFLTDGDLTIDDYDSLINMIKVRYPDDDNDGFRELRA